MSPATEIKAADVQKLRQSTGAGLMDCKKALTETNGDMEKAVKLLRERNIAKSSKRADKTAAEGLVKTFISPDGKSAVIFELNCETDFVAKNEEFVGLADELLKTIVEKTDIKSVDQLPIEKIQALSGKIGEKIEARRFARLTVQNGQIAAYIHAGGKLGVLVGVEADKDASKNEAVGVLAKDLALQIAGSAPAYISREQVPAEILQKEKEIALKQVEGQKKPPEILEKIAQGKLNQFYSAQCLVDQPFVKDPNGKQKVQSLLDEVGKKEGLKLNVAQFERFGVGAE